jgi:beta-galactosidase
MNSRHFNDWGWVYLLTFSLVPLGYASPLDGPAAASPVPESVQRDLLYNADWRFFCDDMRRGTPVTDWKWMRAEPGKKVGDLARGPLPADSDPGWQSFSAGQAVFRDQPGAIWLQTTLPTSNGPHRTLHLSGSAAPARDVGLIDAQLGLGIAIVDQTVKVFLNDQLIASQSSADFDVSLDSQWKADGPNVLVLLIATSKATGTSALGSASVVDSGEETEFQTNFDDHSWPLVNLPHWDRLETYHESRPYQGFAWYRKTLTPRPEMKGKQVTLEFEGVMQVADMWVNGEHRTTHYGGYLPFTIDLTNDVKVGAPVSIAVKVDSRDNNLVPPGKPITSLDFEYYNGIYRDVWLHVTAPVHITDAIVANKPAGGGILVTYPAVSSSAATVQVQTEVANETAIAYPVHVATSLMDSTGQEVAKNQSDSQQIGANSSSVFVQKMQVTNPQLWHPDHPNLYRLQVAVSDGTQPVDEQTLRIGIRTLAIDPQNGFVLNGEPLMLSGANRHQYYPWIGGALSDNAQYRDLWKLKNAGWNFVRLAHYPQTPAVMDACDELGLVAIVCEPGWQYWKDDPVFWSRMQQDIREMVRWHRNHASAAFWEITINEAYAPITHVNEWYQAVHEELPGDQTFTCGDTRNYARSQGKGKILTADPEGLQLDVPYPSWEDKEPVPADANSRKRLIREYVAGTRDQLGNGDAALLHNAQECMAKFDYWLRQPSICAASFWSYMDYMRGYSPVDSGRGAVSMARVPKFSYFAFQSQRDPKLIRKDIESGPMAFIANYWMPNSPTDVVIFSNCQEVELFVNGTSVARQSPDKAAMQHPAFTFSQVAYQPGELKAIGYIGGEPVVTTIRKTSQAPTHLKLIMEDAGRPLVADGADCIFVHAQVLDDNGTVVPDAKETVQFESKGDVQIVSETSRLAEAGVASILIRAGLHPGAITVTASCAGLSPDTLEIGLNPPDSKIY